MNMARLFLFLAFVIVLPAASETIEITDLMGPAGFRIEDQSATGITVTYEMHAFTLSPVERGMVAVTLPGALIPNEAGAPDLASMGRFIAIPQGATAEIEVLARETRTYNGVSVAPAPVIPLGTDDDPLHYEKDASIYERDAFYPAQPIRVTAPGRMRGIDVVTLGVMPFQYNPVAEELIAYTRITVRIDFIGGSGHFGEDKYRSRHFEPILRGQLLNYESLPQVDFTAPRGNRDGYEFIIITPDHPDFIAWGDTLKAWRKLQGISSEVFTTTDIGGTSSYAIWSWIHAAYNEWDISPVGFIILGDYPNSGDGRDSGVTSPIFAGYCVSDNMYADAEVGDNLPDMAHGRITARDADDLENMIGKLLSYERNPPMDQAVYEHPLFAGAWQTDRWFTLCTEVLYGFHANVLGEDPTREYVIYSGDPDTLWSTNPNTPMVLDYFGPSGLGYVPATPEHLTDWGATTARIVADFNAGTYLAIHRDHGSVYGWPSPVFLTGHLPQLTNEVYPFVFSINCASGKYDYMVECFAEGIHRIEHGALGVIAASEVSYSFVNDTFVWGTWDGLWQNFMPDYPSATRPIDTADLRPGFAMIYGKYFLAQSAWPGDGDGDGDRDARVTTYHLFHNHGGVFTPLYCDVPQALTVVHDDHLELDAATFSVTADAGAVIGLTVDGEIIGVGDATGAPLEIPIEPQSEAGTLRITVTLAGHLRYDESIPIERGTLIVDPSGGGDFLTIQAAIDAAEPDDIIELVDGVYLGTGNWCLRFHPDIPVTIQSLSGNATACSIYCQGDDYAIATLGADESVRFRNMTMRRVNETNAFYCNPGAVLTLEDCILEENISWIWGGVIWAQEADIELIGCRFESCGAFPDGYGGGGVGYFESSTVTANDCIFIDNDGYHGGAIYCTAATAEFNRCVFVDNRAVWGTSIYCRDGTALTLHACTFYGGDGLSASDFGHTICLPEGTGGGTTITNTIVAFSELGSAIHCGSPTAPTLECCDLYGNAGGDWTGFIAEQFGYTNISLDPAFCDPMDGDFQLWNYSPCVQALCGRIGAYGVGCHDFTSSDEPAGEDAIALTALQAEPFGAGARIAFTVPAASAGLPVKLGIYSVDGRLIRTLLETALPAGEQVINWNGASDAGSLAEDGIYFCRLDIGPDRRVERLIVIN